MPGYLIIDLEMCKLHTKEKKKLKGLNSEIIQIGAVIVDDGLSIVDEFSTYVNPEYGEIDEYIEGLTGITNADVENAPKLMSAICQLSAWIGNRNVVMMSWSDSDYYQLRKEMKVKSIKFSKIDKLFNGWIDLQRSFDEMLGNTYQTSLEKALIIASISLKGRQHNGLMDAYNTARLFVELKKQDIFQLELYDISQENIPQQRMGCSMGDFFNSDILEQFGVSRCQEDAVESDGMEDWDILARVYKMYTQEELPEDINWKQFVFYCYMRRRKYKAIVDEKFGKDSLFIYQ